jgi:hypothetical protein
VLRANHALREARANVEAVRELPDRDIARQAERRRPARWAMAGKRLRAPVSNLLMRKAFLAFRAGEGIRTFDVHLGKAILRRERPFLLVT